MNYTSNFFLLILSALVPLLYFLGRNGAKGNYIGKVILTLVSLFVIWSHGTFDLVLFLVVSVINYVFSIIIFNSTSEKKKQLLISAVVVDILILSYFKYAEFVASIFSADLSVGYL
jgi:alginate O-acetyltransferase complex protein AlgI